MMAKIRDTDDHNDEMESPEDSASAGRLAYKGPRSPVRVMQIIEALAAAPQGMSLTLLAREFDIPKTSLLNHLRVLVGTGHVALRDSVYLLGPAAIRLGIIISASFGARAAIGPIVKQLAEDCGETALCGMLDTEAREVIYIEVCPGRQAVQYSPPAGTRRPLYCAGLGRALLAFQDEAFILAYLQETKLNRFNAATVTSGAKLRKLLEQERADQIVITVGERIDELGAVAAPIVDRQGRVQYSIGVTVPVNRLVPMRKRLIPMVRAAAQRASWALGG